MLLPSISRPPRPTRMDETKPAGDVDEARRRARVQPERIDDRGRAGRHALLVPAQQVRRDPDRVAAVLAHLARDGQQVLAGERPRQLDQHRQIDAGDHLDVVADERHREIRRGPAEHVGQDEHRRRAAFAVCLTPGARSRAPISSRACPTSSCQPIETAAKCGRSPTIISAELTSSVASCPCVTTSTPSAHAALLIPDVPMSDAHPDARAVPKAPSSAPLRWRPSGGVRRCSRSRSSGTSFPRERTAGSGTSAGSTCA